MPTVLENIARLGITLEKPVTTFGSYVPARRIGNLIYVSGQLPMVRGQLAAVGPVPSRASVDQAIIAARHCVHNALLAVSSLEGGVNRLTSVVRIGVFVQSDDGFAEQPTIANAASDLLIQIFGEAGRHARVAVGTNALPLNASVEIEFLFEAAPE